MGHNGAPNIDNSQSRLQKAKVTRDCAAQNVRCALYHLQCCHTAVIDCLGKKIIKPLSKTPLICFLKGDCIPPLSWGANYKGSLVMVGWPCPIYISIHTCTMFWPWDIYATALCRHYFEQAAGTLLMRHAQFQELRDGSLSSNHFEDIWRFWLF